MFSHSLPQFNVRWVQESSMSIQLGKKILQEDKNSAMANTVL